MCIRNEFNIVRDLAQDIVAELGDIAHIKYRLGCGFVLYVRKRGLRVVVEGDKLRTTQVDSKNNRLGELGMPPEYGGDESFTDAKDAILAVKGFATFADLVGRTSDSP